MAFVENLKKKIKIDSLARQVADTLGPPDGGVRIDRRAMEALMDRSPYRKRSERDLLLYIHEGDDGGPRILVLDNELALYQTTIQDVLLRKSPSLKEMISIRNAIKILNDKDVVVSRLHDSLSTIHQACLDMLDLSFSKADVDGIAKAAAAAFERADRDGVTEGIELFSALLGLKKPAVQLGIGSVEVTGGKKSAAKGKGLFGPLVLYDPQKNRLLWVAGPVDLHDEAEKERLRHRLGGIESPKTEGVSVFERLSEAVVSAYGLKQGETRDLLS